MRNIMKPHPDIGSVLPVSDIDMDSAASFVPALEEARNYIGFYEWVSGIKCEFVGPSLDVPIYIFLFEIIPGREDVDDWLWVIVGDIPSAYITCENARNPYEALDRYVGAMEAWVEAARTGASVAELIPVDVPATPANATLLGARLKFIDERVLPLLR